MRNFIEELRWRNMLHDMTPGVEELLNTKKVVGYIGFDPTAPSMTIGNLVQIQLLTLFQMSGHTPIVLMGGATGRIGDPSGKDKERDLKSEDVLDSNLAFQLQQVKKFLNFSGIPNKAIVVNNLDHYKDMNVLEFLRKVGKTLTVSYMMSKDSVKNRLESGLSFTEFSYQLLQAYDFQKLYDEFGCVIQMGGSDQWGNITSGTEFIRRNVEDGKAYAVTTPLLTKSDGKKFGKSEQGNIWLDPKMTSPYKFYQFCLNCDDADIEKFMRYFTLKTQEEAESLFAQYKEDPRGLKQIFADEFTARVHSPEALQSVALVSDILFNKNAQRDSLLQLNESDFETIGEEIPGFTIGAEAMTAGVNIVDFLTDHCPVFTSKGEARRAIQNSAISINKLKVGSHEESVDSNSLLKGKYLMLENGKKNKYLIRTT